MKTALIFYGFFRTFDFCKETLKKHVLDVTNADVFFSTPNTIYARKEDEEAYLHEIFSRGEKSVDQEITSFFGKNLKHYHIKGYDSNIYKKFIEINNIPKRIDLTNQFSWRVASSLHNFCLSLNLFKSYVELTGSIYDVVIITRPDIRYYNDFNLSALELDKINCPKFFAIDPSHEELNDFTQEQKKDINLRRRFGGAGVHGFDRWLNDNILVGNQSNMIKLSNVFDNVLEYVKNGVCFNYETMLGAYMIKNNISFVGTDFVIYELWRPQGYEW